MPIMTKHNIGLDLGSLHVYLHFYQEWLEWLKYRDYKWHNFTFFELSVVDNYPFHGQLDLEINFAILGLNFILEIERGEHDWLDRAEVLRVDMDDFMDSGEEA